jgi:hypothetical protein
MPEIERRHRKGQATIGAGSALSDPIDLRPYAAGVISVPTGWTSASIGFYHCTTIDGTYQPLYKADGTRLEIAAAASRDYLLPDEILGCAFIKLWSQTSGSDVNQGSARAIHFNLEG